MLHVFLLLICVWVVFGQPNLQTPTNEPKAGRGKIYFFLPYIRKSHVTSTSFWGTVMLAALSHQARRQLSCSTMWEEAKFRDGPHIGDPVGSI